MNIAAEIAFVPLKTGPGFAALGWDSEGTIQSRMNLLRPVTAPVFEVEIGGAWSDGASQVRSVKSSEGGCVVRIGASDNPELSWQVERTAAGMRWSLIAAAGSASAIQRIRLTLPFDPRHGAVSVLPSCWLPPDGFSLPAVLSAPDTGQLLMTQRDGAAVAGRFTGSRKGKTIDVAFEIPVPAPGGSVTIDFAHAIIPTPANVDPSLWRKLRRGWWNVFTPCVCGDLASLPTSISPPAGVLSNNPISDPVSSLYAFIADHAVLVPQLAHGISSEYLLRSSLDWWLDARTGATGTVISYYDMTYQLDAPASVLIAAWACLEISGDPQWISGRIAVLERIAGFLLSRDVDGDGIIESPRSGIPNTLSGAARGSSAWDTINSGHKDIYINALVYRAFRCLSAVETRLQRPQQALLYATAADRLKAAFRGVFLDPARGALAWWIDSAGQRHEYDAPGMLALPIAYGLLPANEAKDVLGCLRRRAGEIGFTRLDLGLPYVLGPIRRGDYLLGCGKLCGAPEREDGSDTFGVYLNGSCVVSDQIHWFNAHFRLAQNAAVKPQYTAMMARQARPVYANGGSYQNGIVDQIGKGAEFYAWDGSTSGYEGHLVYSFFILQAALTCHPEHFRRLYGVLDPL